MLEKSAGQRVDRKRVGYTSVFNEPVREVRHFHVLDVVRGVAALAILTWHYQHFFAEGMALPGTRTQYPLYAFLWPLYEGGGAAVQLFWVISGFVFAAVYAGSTPSFRSFFGNRVARLYPLHLVTLIVVATLQAVSFVVLGRYLIYTDNTVGSFLLNLAFVSGWDFIRTDAFNGPIWSVSLELLVYGLFWLALPRLFRFGALLPALVAVFSFAGFLVAPHISLLNCAFDFFAGCTIYVLYRSLPSALSLAGGLTAVALAIAVGAVFHKQGVATILAFNGVVLLCAVAEPFAPIAARLRWFGDCTYGIYLWHVPVQLATLIAVYKLGLPKEIFQSPAALLAFVGVVVAIARLSYLTIEAPGRLLIQRWLHARKGADPGIAGP